MGEFDDAAIEQEAAEMQAEMVKAAAEKKEVDFANDGVDNTHESNAAEHDGTSD